MRIWISALILAMAAAGCGSSPPPQDKDKEDAAPTPTVFDDTLKAIDKAQESQALQENRVNDLNRQLDAPPADPNADQESK